MSVPEDRIRACLMGAFVADAACLGTHWIYDVEQMAAAVPSLEAPEFKNPPAPNFYSASDFPGHYEAGCLSPYGEQLLFVSQYVAREGKVEGAKMSEAMKAWATAYTGRQDHATKSFLDNGPWPNCGADDSQCHCFMKLVPVTCLYAGSAERRPAVAEAIRVHQKNHVALEYGLLASDILELVLLGETTAAAVEKVEKTASALAAESFAKARSGVALKDLLTEVKDRSCALPGSFVAPVHQMLRGGDFAQNVRENIIVAGDTCGRAVLVGAVAGAASGVPSDWVGKLSTAKDSATQEAKPLVGLVEELSRMILQHRKDRGLASSPAPKP